VPLKESANLSAVSQVKPDSPSTRDQIDAYQMAGRKQIQQFLAENNMAGIRNSSLINRPLEVQQLKENQAKKSFLGSLLQALPVGMMAMGEGMTGRPFYTNYMDNQAGQAKSQLAMQQWQDEQKLREREVRVKEAGTSGKLMTGEGLPEADQLAGYKLAVKIAGQRKAADVAPMVYGLMKQGKTMDQIEDELRYSGQSKEFAGPVRDAAQSIYSKAPKDIKDSGMDYIDDLLSHNLIA
jgi:hypothetical protein